MQAARGHAGEEFLRKLCYRPFHTVWLSTSMSPHKRPREKSLLDTRINLCFPCHQLGVINLWALGPLSAAPSPRWIPPPRAMPLQSIIGRWQNSRKLLPINNHARPLSDKATRAQPNRHQPDGAIFAIHPSPPRDRAPANCRLWLYGAGSVEP